MRDIRPVAVNKHPLVKKSYILATPSIDEFCAQALRCIRYRTPGAITYSLPRYGKTFAIRYCTHVILAEYLKVPVYSFLCEKKARPSEAEFFGLLLLECGHKDPHKGSIGAKRKRLIEHLHQKANDSGHDMAVVFADEAQRLAIIEYEWLRDVHDQLDKRGVRMITFLVGQHELLAQKNALRGQKQMQIVGRFMIEELRFRGLLSSSDFATCLQGYDESCYPVESEWSYTRFFLPQAHLHGLRLVNYAQVLWEIFEEVHESARMGAVTEIPMHYFARTLEIALLENMEHDSPDFSLTPVAWREAVAASCFLQSQIELREMLSVV